MKKYYFPLGRFNEETEKCVVGDIYICSGGSIYIRTNESHYYWCVPDPELNTFINENRSRWFDLGITYISFNSENMQRGYPTASMKDHIKPFEPTATKKRKVDYTKIASFGLF